MFDILTGDELFGLVTQYADLGDHRTGTATDSATRDWFARSLQAAGATVVQVDYDFDGFEAVAKLTVGGALIPALPLAHSGIGLRLVATEPQVRRLTLAHGIAPWGLDELLDGEPIPAGGLVVVLGSDHGGLVAMNRSAGQGPAQAVALVGDAWEHKLAHGPLRLDWQASVVPRSSATVVGRLGWTGGPPMLITTPLTGWFRCAGERGTGVAIALALASALASRVPVQVVGTTGHELGHLGLDHWLAHRGGDPKPLAVLHVGASIATPGPTETGWSPLRWSMTNVTEPFRGALSEVLAAIDAPVRDHGPVWPGEGQAWRELGVPVLSVTGGFEHFHQPTDLPPVATSPRLLWMAGQALLDATDVLLDGVVGGALRIND